MFYGRMPLLTHNHSLQTSGSPVVIASTSILRNAVENHLSKAGMPHPDSPIWAPILRKWQEIQLSWPSKLGKFLQGPITVGLKSEFPSPR